MEGTWGVQHRGISVGKVTVLPKVGMVEGPEALPGIIALGMVETGT